MDLMVNDGDHEWNRFFQETLKVDLEQDDGKNVCFSQSENGVDVEITQSELDRYIGCLTTIPKVYDRLKYGPSAAQRELVLMVAAHIGKDEKNFLKTNVHDTYRNLVKIAEVTKPNTDVQVKIRYIEMLCSLFEHASGLRWCLETNFWTQIYDLVIECQSHSKCLAYKAHNMLSKLLQKTSRIAPKICNHITRQVVQMLMNVAIKHLPNTKKVPVEHLDPAQYTNLAASVVCLLETLERLLASPVTDTLKYFIKLQVREACDTLAILSDDSDFSLLLIRIMILLSFYEMTDLFDGIKVVNHDPLALSGFVRIMERELRKEHFQTMFEGYYYSQKYWKNVSRKMPKYFVKEVSIDIEDELMSLQMEPMIIIAEKLLGMSRVREEELRNCYLADLLNMCSVNGLHLGYEIRKHLPRETLQIELDALKCLIKSKPLYSRKNLAIVFQGLIYSLKDFIQYTKQYPSQGQFDEDQLLAETLLEAILVYLENFDLSWRESIGSIELTNLVYEFLYSLVDSPAEIVVKTLKILNTTISKHMSPNMALLVDTTQNSSMNELGSLLFTKCFNSDPDVRNAALTVVCTMCQEANKGFRSFEKVLTESLMQDLILTMSISDVDTNVRTTALKCLQEIIVMDDVGKTLLMNNFVDKILNIISTSQETMVTKEAIILIGKVYQNDIISPEETVKMYDELVSVGLNEAAPEIQEQAVKFWALVTDKHLEQQGMLDDEFPPVIFSKEHKKIVRLDDKEIRKRIFNALDGLSKAGCFVVFQNVLQNENTSKEVFATTVTVVTKYIRLLQKYEVTPEIILFNQSYPHLWSIPSHILSPSHQLEDQRMQELIEETVMEMINDSESFSHIKSTSTNNETGELFHKSPLHHTQVNTVDFVDFIYRKLPFLAQDDFRSSCSNTVEKNKCMEIVD